MANPALCIVKFDVMGTGVHFQAVIDELDLLGVLARFEPVVIGTPPLGLAVADSDIDVACYAVDGPEFERVAARHFGHLTGFAIRRFAVFGVPAITASFCYAGWPVELFCQAVRTQEQWGVRHFYVEQRLLRIAPDLKDAVLARKRRGLKTEPAFAEVLRLPGEPYAAMLALEGCSDEALRQLVARAIGGLPN